MNENYFLVKLAFSTELDVLKATKLNYKLRCGESYVKFAPPPLHAEPPQNCSISKMLADWFLRKKNTSNQYNISKIPNSDHPNKQVNS